MKYLKNIGLLIVSSLWLLSGCIKDDFVEDEVDPTLRIISVVDTIAIDSTFLFEAVYLNNIGDKEEVEIDWTTSDSNVLSINEDGIASAISLGESTVFAMYNDNSNFLKDSIKINVGETTSGNGDVERTGTIRTTSSYQLTGDFTVEQDGDEIVIEIQDNYRASTALPGLYVYLTNNPNTTSGALEIGKVDIFSGAHTYRINDVGVMDYNYLLYFCKPFNVKVGDGEIN